VLGIVFVGGRPGTVEEQVLTPEVPAAPAPVEEPTGDEARPSPAGSEERPAGAGRVILDVQQAEFFVEPGQPGEPLRVEARYDRESCKLTEQLDPDHAPGWVYTLEFRCEQRSFLQSLRSLLGGKKEKVLVLLPPDLPLELEVRGSQGGSILELGGLWLTSLDVEFEMGGLVVNVGSPLREPVDSMTLRGSMGGLVASGLGNASPRRLEVDYRMGGMELDLRGRWVADADIDIDLRMGGGNVTLPDGVLIEGLPSGVRSASPAPEIKPPTLRFTTKTVQGGMEFSD
jgi:hypothetical protein